ncbi:hypothetical protein K2X33_02415, partial [bacterium]|nr:hypothetical protein [bacterium]
LLTGFALLVGACGKENPPARSATATSAKTAAENQQQWVKADADGVSGIAAMKVEASAEVLQSFKDKGGELDPTKNCFQVLRPVAPKGADIAYLEFLDQPCDQAIVVGEKRTKFVLTLRHAGETPPATGDNKDVAPLLGTYDVFGGNKDVGTMKVGEIVFEHGKATITSLCTGPANEAICQVNAVAGLVAGFQMKPDAIAALNAREAEQRKPLAQKAKEASDRAKNMAGQVQTEVDHVTGLIGELETASQQTQGDLRKELQTTKDTVAAKEAEARALQEKMQGLEAQLATVTADRDVKAKENASNVKALQEARAALATANTELEKAKVQVKAADVKIQAEVKKDPPPTPTLP